MSEIYQCILSDALIWVNGETTSTVRGQLETATVLYTVLIFMTMNFDSEIFLWQYTSNPNDMKHLKDVSHLRHYCHDQITWIFLSYRSQYVIAFSFPFSVSISSTS